MSGADRACIWLIAIIFSAVLADRMIDVWAERHPAPAVAPR